ncbi:hypothetical protein Adt_20088 [Abeliophyllum distichum]|uniref:Uncharacterized protein n=1 Tax=Abeliophyllum distichum TaxID=126358 RepID=A0ABD1SUS7_9LAMI
MHCPKKTVSRKSLSHWDSSTLQLAPHMEQRLVQEPLPMGLGHLAAYSSHGATLPSRASPTGTRPPCSLLLPRSNASHKSLLFHRDSAILQLALHMEQRFAQEPLPLGLDHLAACSSHGATLRTRASPTGTRPPCSLLLTWSNASHKSLSHWDSTTLQLAPPTEQRLAQDPLPLGLGHLATCSSHGATLRARSPPTGTRPPCNLFIARSNASRKSPSHWYSATLQLAPHIEQRFTQEPLLLRLGHLVACSSYGATPRARASPTRMRPPCNLLLP